MFDENFDDQKENLIYVTKKIVPVDPWILLSRKLTIHQLNILNYIRMRLVMRNSFEFYSPNRLYFARLELNLRKKNIVWTFFSANFQFLIYSTRI